MHSGIFSVSDFAFIPISSYLSSNMKKSLVLVLLLLLFASCSSTYRVSFSQSHLDSYIGCSHQQLVQFFGAPIDQVSDGTSELFTYSDRYVAKSHTLPKAQFYMNSDGICYKVRAANTDPVRVTSVGRTIAMVLLLLLIL